MNTVCTHHIAADLLPGIHISFQTGKGILKYLDIFEDEKTTA